MASSVKRMYFYISATFPWQRSKVDNGEENISKFLHYITVQWSDFPQAHAWLLCKQIVFADGKHEFSTQRCIFFSEPVTFSHSKEKKLMRSDQVIIMRSVYVYMKILFQKYSSFTGNEA